MLKVPRSPCQMDSRNFNNLTPVLADGAYGTILMPAVPLADQGPEDLLTSNPEIVRRLHQSYLISGARIISTHTFNLPRLLEAQNLSLDKVIFLLNAALDLAMSVRPQHGVILSLGPAAQDDNGLLTYREIFSVAQNYPLLAIQFETLTSIQQAQSILTAAHLSHNRHALILSTSPDYRGQMRDGKVMDIKSLRYSRLLSGVGINCVEARHEYINLLRHLKKTLRLPLLYKPSAGITRWMNPRDWAQQLSPALEVVDTLAGCCGTSPAHIKALQRHLGEFHQ